MQFTIAKKLTLLVTVVVVITSGVLGYSVNTEYDKLLTNQALENMGENTGEEAAEIVTTIKRMNEDVLFLSSTPPIQGLIRTQVNNGTDYIDGSTEKVWKNRLATIFKSFLESKPHYQSIRYIGVKNSGKELVRVENNKGKIKSYIYDNLQHKSHRIYYKKGLTLKRKQIYISGIDYNREYGEIIKPYQLVMRSVTPVYTKEGDVFGVVVINISVEHLFEDFLSSNNNTVHRYIINSKGGILDLVNEGEVISFGSKKLSTILLEHPEWSTLFSKQEETEVTKKIVIHNKDIALYAKKLFFDENEKDRFVVLIEEKPYETVIKNASNVKKHSIIVAVILLLSAIVITIVFSNLFTKPLKKITNTLTHFKDNRGEFKLDINSNDEIGALASAFRDVINDLDQAQEQLIQSDKMASIGQLAAGVAHEINNPVGFIGSNINALEIYCEELILLLDEYETADEYLKNDVAHWNSIDKVKKDIDLDYLKKDIVKLIAESTDGVKRVKDIVQDLKDFSHVDESEWQFIDIHAGLDSTLNIVHNEIKYKAEVVKHYGDLPEVECIGSQLNQVFMNLLVNAAHAIDEHGTIKIETGLTDSEWVWISISDTGKGIPKSKMKNIFDPFFTTKPIGQGTGLGLSLSYGIIEKHSGRIDVESVEGVGTTFSIWLPVKQPKLAKAV
jgi:signal transduction histidine kinase